MFGSILRFALVLAVLALAQGIVWSAGTSLLNGADVARNATAVAAGAVIWLAMFIVLSRALRLAARRRANSPNDQSVDLAHGGKLK